MFFSFLIPYFFILPLAYSAPSRKIHDRRDISLDDLLDYVLDPPDPTNYQAPTFLTEAQGEQDHYSIFAAFSQAAYCVQSIQGLNCGEYCSSISDAQLVYSTGDSGETPDAYIAWSSSLNSIIVAHEGTNPENLLSIMNDLEFGLVDPDSDLGISGKVHSGFQETWKRTIDTFSQKVQDTLDEHSGASITTTGHSLGAAIALLDGLYFQNKFSDVTVTTYLYGLPRVGDLNFANSADDKLGSNVHYVVHNEDPVPHLPPYVFGYSQIDSEIWLPSNNSIMSCPGIENQNCADSVTSYNVTDHFGPYFGVMLSSDYCPSTSSVST